MGILFQTDSQEILRNRGVAAAESVSPSLAIPLLRAAADESREQIQEIWARIIAAAMDPKRSDRVRQSFIATVSRLDPLDALVLKNLYEVTGNLSPNPRDFLASRLQVSSREIDVSVINLEELKCVRMPHQDTAFFSLTSYGFELVRLLSD